MMPGLLHDCVAVHAQNAQVSPAPYLTPLPLRPPCVTVDGGLAGGLESDLLMAGLLLDHVRNPTLVSISRSVAPSPNL
jgi:hypothetical protein